MYVSYVCRYNSSEVLMLSIVCNKQTLNKFAVDCDLTFTHVIAEKVKVTVKVRCIYSRV
jgi:hypothetical protein